MNKFKYPIYWTMLALSIYFGIKGRLFTLSDWNLWTFPAVVMLMLTVFFVVKYDVESNPLKIWKHERKLKEGMNRVSRKVNRLEPEMAESELERDSAGKEPIRSSKEQAEADQITSEPLMEETYEFAYTLSDAETIKRLADYIIENQTRMEFDRQNIQLGYGVVDKERTIFIALIYYLSDSIKRCDNGIDDFKYAVVTQDEIFTVFCQSRFGSPVIRLEIGNHGRYKSIVKQAINFAHSTSEIDWSRELKVRNPDFNLRRYNESLKEKYLKGMGLKGMNFIKDVLSYSDELDEEGYKKLQGICDVLNGQGISSLNSSHYQVENFKLQHRYGMEKYRLINKEGDVWLFFIGCTDGTHAPVGFKESEWLMFYYRGFAAELHFEEQIMVPRIFKLKFSFINGCHIVDINELHMTLVEKGISVDEYYHILREALDALHPNSSNYYVF